MVHLVVGHRSTDLLERPTVLEVEAVSDRRSPELSFTPTSAAMLTVACIPAPGPDASGATGVETCGAPKAPGGKKAG